MKLSFSLVLKDDPELKPLLEWIRTAGFNGVEPTFGKGGVIPGIEAPEQSAERLRTLAHAIGLQIPSMRGGLLFWDLFASDKASDRLAAVDLATQAMKAVKLMGGDVLLIVPGRWDANQTYEAVWRNALDTAKRIGEAAEAIGITIGLENVENGFLLSPSEWQNFLDSVANPRVRMYFDAGNVVYLRRGHPDQWLRQMGRKRITRVHIKDAREGGPLTLLTGGDVDWPKVISALRDIGYDDWIGVELPLSAKHPSGMLHSTCDAAQQILASGPLHF